MTITRTLIDGQWHDVKEYYECLDLSEAYAYELNNLEVQMLNNDEMETFLNECLDESVEFIWEMIRVQHSCHDMHLIDFDSGYLKDDHQIEVKLSDSLSVITTVNIFFDIAYNVNNPRYDDSGCYHDYKAPVAINEYKAITKIKNLEVA